MLNTDIDLKCARWMELEEVNEVPHLRGSSLSPEPVFPLTKIYTFVRVDNGNGFAKSYSSMEHPNMVGWIAFLDHHNKSWTKKDIIMAPKYSTDWVAAGPLLDAMNADLYRNGDEVFCLVSHEALVCGDKFPECADWRMASAPTSELAIVKACLILIEHGIKRSDI